MNLYGYHNKPENLHGYEKRGLTKPFIKLDLPTKAHKLSQEQMKVVNKDPELAYLYAFYTKTRMGDAEKVIAKDPEFASKYWKFIINMPDYGNRDDVKPDIIRWKLGEDAIIKEPAFAAEYARDAIKGRWPEAEPTILKDLHVAVRYAQQTIKGRWPELEEIINSTTTTHRRLLTNLYSSLVARLD